MAGEHEGDWNALLLYVIFFCIASLINIFSSVVTPIVGVEVFIQTAHFRLVVSHPCMIYYVIKWGLNDCSEL
jgi:hypothetical protein